MSYNAQSTPVSVRLRKAAKYSLSFDLQAEGLELIDGKLIKVNADQVDFGDRALIEGMDVVEFEDYLKPLTKGARFLAYRIRGTKWMDEKPSDDELMRQLAAWKEARKWLQSQDQETIDFLKKQEVSPAVLILDFGLRWSWEFARFVSLYKEVCVHDRNWRSCYQISIDLVKAIALTPNFNRLPLWVKRVMIDSGNVPMSEDARIGNIWRLIPCAKAWKIAPDLPKHIAERVGKMYLWKRLAAKVAWEETLTQLNIYAAKLREIRNYSDQYDRLRIENTFWVKFNNLVQEGKYSVLDKAGQIDRTITVLFGKQLDRKEALMLHALILNAKQLHSEWSDQDFPLGEYLVGLSVKAWKQSLDRLLPEGWRESITNIKSAKTAISDEWGFVSAYKVAAIFGKRSQEWLKKQDSLGRSAHDATYWLPKTGIKPNKGLDRFLFSNGHQPITDLEAIASNWSFFSEEQKELPFKELIVICRSKVYPGAQHEGFAAESAKWGVSQRDYSGWEKRFLASLNTHSPFPLDKTWEVAELVGRFLPRSDVRGLYLGQYTNCCQHPSGAGSACAWYGQESPNSGFFVVEKGDEIVAMSWVWISDEGGICFDNVEAKGLGDRTSTVQQIYQSVANSLSANAFSVTIGTGLGDMDLSPWEQAKGDLANKMPLDYSGYRDSASQVLLAQNPHAPRDRRELGEVWVRGAFEEDSESAMAVSALCYPEEWQGIGTEESDHGMVLEHRDHGIIGYATIETDNHYISDMAVSPDHRKHSKTLIDAVLAYCSRIGGEWSADCRESTSYRLLKLYERRGKIAILGEKESLEGDMDGERMIHVSFSV